MRRYYYESEKEKVKLNVIADGSYAIGADSCSAKYVCCCYKDWSIVSGKMPNSCSKDVFLEGGDQHEVWKAKHGYC